jgi:hypothetical protein
VTYAHYKLWAGVLLRDLPDAGRDISFVSYILDSLDGVDESGQKFTSINMHTSTVGVGVEIVDLDWTTEEEGPTIFDPSIVTVTAAETLHEVNEIFKAHGIRVTVKLYHHLDLGG